MLLVLGFTCFVKFEEPTDPYKSLYYHRCFGDSQII